MVKRGEEFFGDASERVMSLEEEVVAGFRSRFSEKRSVRGVFDESARAAAMISVCPHRSWPNQPPQRNERDSPLSVLLRPSLPLVAEL